MMAAVYQMYLRTVVNQIAKQKSLTRQICIAVSQQSDNFTAPNRLDLHQIKSNRHYADDAKSRLKPQVTLSTKRNLQEKKIDPDLENNKIEGDQDKDEMTKSKEQTQQTRKANPKNKTKTYDKLIENVGKEIYPKAEQSKARSTMKSEIMSRISKIEHSKASSTTSFVESMFENTTYKPSPMQGEQKRTTNQTRSMFENTAYKSSQMQEEQKRTANLTRPGPMQQNAVDTSEEKTFKFDLESAGRLDVFPKRSALKESPSMPVPSDTEKWTALDWFNKYQDDVRAKLVKDKEITNQFQEYIQLTNEGKLWTFPINNEEGMEKEQEVPFYSHVFLEDRLEDWCPKSGPLRLFMNAVTMSLSLNGDLTLEEKHEHIDWFRQYFEEKMKVLQHLGIVAT